MKKDTSLPPPPPQYLCFLWFTSSFCKTNQKNPYPVLVTFSGKLSSKVLERSKHCLVLMNGMRGKCI